MIATLNICSMNLKGCVFEVQRISVAPLLYLYLILLRRLVVEKEVNA